LGHPFQVVIWLAEELKRQGKRLRTGDVISLGSFSQPQPPRAGQTVSVVYTGLPGGPMRVSVKFH
jgi:2-keto-4-pentenoate hydratase